ncbi:MAG: hypothetical protein KA536_21200 [Saprospiraceae bacterium]|nr:hypothetical protein [Saprospiraceae bacterium]
MKYFLFIIIFALSLLSSCLLNKKNRTKNANLVELGCIKIDYGLTSYFYPSEDKVSYVEFLKSQQSGYLQFLLDSNYIDSPYMFVWQDNELLPCFMTKNTFKKIELHHKNLDSYIFNNKKLILKISYKPVSHDNQTYLFVEDILFMKLVDGITRCD